MKCTYICKTILRQAKKKMVEPFEDEPAMIHPLKTRPKLKLNEEHKMQKERTYF